MKNSPTNHSLKHESGHKTSRWACHTLDASSENVSILCGILAVIAGCVALGANWLRVPCVAGSTRESGYECRGYNIFDLLNILLSHDVNIIPVIIVAVSAIFAFILQAIGLGGYLLIKRSMISSRSGSKLCSIAFSLSALVSTLAVVSWFLVVKSAWYKSIAIPSSSVNTNLINAGVSFQVLSALFSFAAGILGYEARTAVACENGSQVELGKKHPVFDNASISHNGTAANV